MSDSKVDVLIVDDEESMRDFLEIVLQNENLRVETAKSGVEAIEKIKEHSPRVFIQDLRMGGLDGMDLLEQAKNLKPDMPVIVITAYSTWESAVEAMRLGAFDFLKKPFDNENIRCIVQRALGVSDLITDTNAVHRLMVGNSEPMQQLYDVIKLVAPTDSTVLVRGESGTGKELVARSVHASSIRRDNSFVAINCSAFVDNLLESELFGHVKGSFTGANSDRKGLFEAAQGGTIFLDEVADMNMATQVKMLRVLEERRVMPVGGTSEIPVDVRVIAATNKNLEEEIRSGMFREDLFYRLNVIPVSLPPLRERSEDISMLAGHFLARYAKSMNKTVTKFSPKAHQQLLSYPWPGNVRELDNIIQRQVALCLGDEIEAFDIPDVQSIDLPAAPQENALNISTPGDGFVLDEVMEDIERQFLVGALEKTSGNLTQAAKLLGMSYRSIRYKVKKLQVRDK